ncbi:nuclear transport factor 2 family protein [Kibdelosporangium lantanae]
MTTNLSRFLLPVSIALLVVATGFAAWFGLTWARASGDDADVARAREDVATAGTAAVATLTSLNYNNVDAVYQQYLDVSTGAVHDDYAKNEDSFKKRIKDSKVVTTSVVRQVAVTDVNLQKKEATILVVVDTQVTETATTDPTKQAEQPKRLRIEAALDQTDAGWKVKGLQQVPYSASAQ